MNKDHLLPRLCKALGIDAHEHADVVGIDKVAIKAKMREMKEQRQKHSTHTTRWHLPPRDATCIT